MNPINFLCCKCTRNTWYIAWQIVSACFKSILFFIHLFSSNLFYLFKLYKLWSEHRPPVQNLKRSIRHPSLSYFGPYSSFNNHATTFACIKISLWTHNSSYVGILWPLFRGKLQFCMQLNFFAWPCSLQRLVLFCDWNSIWNIWVSNIFHQLIKHLIKL